MDPGGSYGGVLGLSKCNSQVTLHRSPYHGVHTLGFRSTWGQSQDGAEKILKPHVLSH